MAQKKIDVLGIIAHPDDESFLFAGSSLRFWNEGKRVGVICATKGEKGADRLNRNLTKKQMAVERVVELKKACRIMKVSYLDFYNYPDGQLDQADFSKLITRLKKEIEKFQPKIVLTFGPEGVSGHRDHIAIGKATLDACKQARMKPEQIWLASMPRSLIKEFNEHLNKRKVHHSHFDKKSLKGVADNKLLVIPTGKYKGAKLKAIQAHKSQYVPDLVMKTFLTHEYFEVFKFAK